MQLTNRAQIDGTYQHVYLSPHLDDAALSCGGRIATQIAAGERVLVATLCTGIPAPDAAFSPLAQAFHTSWQLSPAAAIGTRQAEERAALELLGADTYWADMLDAIYRNPAAYHSRATLFHLPDPADPLWNSLRAFVLDLRARLPHALFYAPLGVGQHVDHQITFGVARDVIGPQLAFYEDLPYATLAGELDARMHALDMPLEPHSIAIDATLNRKLAAIHAYPSQLAELFGSAEAMEPTMTNYARSVRPPGSAYGERIWTLG